MMRVSAAFLAAVAAVFIVAGCSTPDSSTHASQAGQPAGSVEAASLPTLKDVISGQNEVRVRNPNNFAVKVGLRSGLSGTDFEVGANGVASAYVPNGPYEIYFIYSDRRDALFQGDSFSLCDNGVEIQIVKVVNGNYNIRQVR